jgi:tetratricopeptide (TPR) repeat protein
LERTQQDYPDLLQYAGLASGWSIEPTGDYKHADLPSVLSSYSRLAASDPDRFNVNSTGSSTARIRQACESEIWALSEQSNDHEAAAEPLANKSEKFDGGGQSVTAGKTPDVPNSTNHNARLKQVFKTSSVLTSDNWFTVALCLSELLKDLPNDANYLARRGRAYARLGRYSDARVDFARALSYEPLNVSHWSMLLESMVLRDFLESKRAPATVPQMPPAPKDPPKQMPQTPSKTS